MYSVNPSTQNIVNNSIGSVRCCPICAGPAHISWEGLDPLLYGVRCRDCGASIPAIHRRSNDAIQVWNRRSGLAAVGGRATKGLCSPRKLAAARRNLEKAREVRQLNRLRQSAEATYAALKPLREQERRLIEARLAESRAELATLEPLIKQDPELSAMLEWLKSCQAHPEDGDWQQGDSCQSLSADSVLITKQHESDHH